MQLQPFFFPLPLGIFLFIIVEMADFPAFIMWKTSWMHQTEEVRPGMDHRKRIEALLEFTGSIFFFLWLPVSLVEGQQGAPYNHRWFLSPPGVCWSLHSVYKRAGCSLPLDFHWDWINLIWTSNRFYFEGNRTCTSSHQQRKNSHLWSAHKSYQCYSLCGASSNIFPNLCWIYELWLAISKVQS